MARLLLDENVPPTLVPALRAAGHDAACVAQLAPGLDDRGVLALARSEARILLTFDADFGDLIFGRGEAARPAVVLFRLHPIVLADLLGLALGALDPPPQGVFVVAARESMRMRPFETPTGALNGAA
jgi:predicted nuclease of predicted toxin-antitoxin system